MLRLYAVCGDAMSVNERACSKEKLSVPALCANAMPLLSATCRVYGFIEASTIHGVCPRRVFTLTTPLLMSPYSTPGIPAITSMLSMLEVEMLRVEADCVSLMLALLFNRIPSISIAVPNAALPFSPVAERSAMRESSVRVELMVCPPGSSAMMSLSDRACEWSSVVRSIEYVVVPVVDLLRAVTSTPGMLRSASFSRMFLRSVLRLMLNCMVRVTYPRVLTSIEAAPWGTFSMANLPLASVAAHNSRFDTLTMAYCSGSIVRSSSTRPDTLKRTPSAIAAADIIKNSNNVTQVSDLEFKPFEHTL